MTPEVSSPQGQMCDRGAPGEQGLRGRKAAQHRAGTLAVQDRKQLHEFLKQCGMYAHDE